MRRHATRIILLLLALLLPAAPAGADGPRLAELLARLQVIRHEPSFVGLWPARARTKAYPPEFQRRELRSADGAPLAAVVALHADDAARPGVVLAHGFTESKNQKYLVELATLLHRNGWHVLALDYRGHGESRALSGAPITFGWKEADDVLAAARLLREESKAASVAVLGFSLGGRVAVKAMVKDGGALLQAGMAFGAPIGEPAPLEPNAPPSPIDRIFLGYLGAGSFYEYYGRAAAYYGVTREFLLGEARADTTIATVRAPLLMVYALDDVLWRAQLRRGRHEGGNFSLRYRDAVRDHPQVATLLVDRGEHAGALYLSDPYWFGSLVLAWLGAWQGREAPMRLPAVDLLLECKMGADTATCSVVVRNSGTERVSDLGVHASLPPGATLVDCWAGVEGTNRCRRDGDRVTWTIPRLSGGKRTAGPFVAVLGTAGLAPGKVDVRAWVDAPDALVQEVTLEKK
ncbi:MAG: alpha/beta fold hydrolase [Elusimicrobia bacterium]|nr:alpha/beta fold hydrolase [Elusimicrobiota bacterium]